uniref:Putative secreted protein n=1 Tax=Ixodes ricinus TaxID=34613 RepID=A0A6B0UPR7_IXORI
MAGCALLHLFLDLVGVLLGHAVPPGGLGSLKGLLRLPLPAAALFFLGPASPELLLGDCLTLQPQAVLTLPLTLVVLFLKHPLPAFLGCPLLEARGPLCRCILLRSEPVPFSGFFLAYFLPPRLL